MFLIFECDRFCVENVSVIFIGVYPFFLVCTTSCLSVLLIKLFILCWSKYSKGALKSKLVLDLVSFTSANVCFLSLNTGYNNYYTTSAVTTNSTTFLTITQLRISSNKNICTLNKISGPIKNEKGLRQFGLQLDNFDTIWTSVRTNWGTLHYTMSKQRCLFWITERNHMNPDKFHLH